MAVETRKRSKLPSPGPFLAEVTNLLDPTFMGSIEVSLIKGVPSSVKLQGETFIVRYMSPFYGVTSVRFEGNNSGAYSDVQKSYGMWMVPPDIGTTVMVIFIDGDPNQGYWIGCVPDMYQNHMVPGIAASRYTALTEEQKRRYGTDYLPVAEFHKASRKMDNPVIDKFTKPVHPFADRLVQQGLLLDHVRGVTSSGARRESPSSVFGISTPGPLDIGPGAKKGPVGYQGKITNLPVNRLGGSTFVMDDGDSDGQNELVRIRTRTGHQILMHNSHDLIYIANGKGTAWIELTSNGKIDIYAQDSVSIHSKSDFNFLADRDINIEAGRNIHIKASGNMETNIVKNYNLIVGADSKILLQGDKHETVASDVKLTVGADYNLSVVNSVKQTSGVDYSIAAGGQAIMGASGNLNLGSSSEILASASKIHLNGPGASVPDAAEAADTPVALPVFSLPNRIFSEGWENSKFYKASDIVTIMKRAPTHEPWDQHENINSRAFSPDQTAVTGDDRVPTSSGFVPSATSGDSSASVSIPESNGKQPAKWAEDEEFIKRVKEVSAKIKCNWIDLLTCMSFESGWSFDPAKRNSIGATGLIQFIPSTARALGTTTDRLAAMTRVEQMDYVEKYFLQTPLRNLKSVTLEDLYMAILWPVAVGKPNDYQIFKEGTLAYKQNNGLDIGKKGYITKADATTKVRQHYPSVTQNLANAGYTDTKLA